MTLNDIVNGRQGYESDEYDPYFDPSSVFYMGGDMPIDFDWLKEGF